MAISTMSVFVLSSIIFNVVSIFFIDFKINTGYNATMKSKYSNNIRKIRKAAGLTLQELSELSGHSIQLIQAYETRTEPKVGVYHNLVRICKQRIDDNKKIAESL